MGVAIGLLGTEAYPLQQVDRLLLRLRFSGTQLVEEHRLGEDLHDLLAWVEGGIGVLEDHLHLPADGAHLLGLEAGDVTPVKRDLARLWLDELDDRTCRGGFAASGLAHQAEHLALLHVETDVVDRVDHLILQRESSLFEFYLIQKVLGEIELLHQVFHLKDLTHGSHLLSAESGRPHSGPDPLHDFQGPWCGRYPGSICTWGQSSTPGAGPACWGPCRGWTPAGPGPLPSGGWS